MSSPSKRQTGVSLKGSLTRQKSGEGDPWCLICGVNLRVDGGTFSVLSKHNNGDLCDIFSRVLGAELSEGYASINMCNRCERQLRRLGRYNSIILARNEGKKLRDQLEKNLAKYGQKVVESGDLHDLDTPAVSQVDSSVPSISSVNSPKKGKVSEGSVGRARPVVASRAPGSGSLRSSKSIDIGGESHAVRNGSGVVARRSSGPGPLLEKKKPSSPFEEVEKRLEARRRKWSNASSTSEDSLTSTGEPKIPSEKKGNGTPSHQQRSVSFQDEVVSKNVSVNPTSQLSSSVLSEEPLDDSDEMETNDKTSLVERKNNGQDYTPLIDTKDDEIPQDDKVPDPDSHDVTEVETSFNEVSDKENTVDDVDKVEVVDDLVVTSPQERQEEVSEVTAVSNGVITETRLEKSIQGVINEQPAVFDGVADKTDGQDQLEDMPNLPPEGAPLTKKSEKSPLISSDLKVKGGKDGKFNDQQPGFLCCTIL